MRRKRILIVDDEENFAYIIKMNLEKTDEYEVRVETRATNALQSAVSFSPDLILLDIVMPDRDGFEVIEALKKDRRSMSVPIVMLTALDEDEARVKAAQQYSEGYLVKPIATEGIKAKVDEVLKRRG